MMTLAGICQAQDFYRARLDAGKEAYRQKRYAEAADQFRIATFGFLDAPPLLSEGLARLALAQSFAARTSDAGTTLSRFVDVERRFGGSYAHATLEPQIRAEFQTLLLQRVPAASLRSVTGLAGLIETPAQKAAKLPPHERRKALEAGFRNEPHNVEWTLGLAQEASERGDDGDVLTWTGRALQIQPGNSEALALQAHARTQRRQYTEALTDLKGLPSPEMERRPQSRADLFVCLLETGDSSGAEKAFANVPPELRTRPDVARANQKLTARLGPAGHATPSTTASASAAASREAAQVHSAAGPGRAGSAGPSPQAAAALAESRRLMDARKAGDAAKILLQALQSEPDNRELRVALLEACCLSGDWRRGAEQVAFVAPFSEREALPMFYAAVVLYQTGRTQEAREYMERARPRVSGQFVDEYAQKILGRS